MTAESTLPYLTFRESDPKESPPLAYFYELPTAARVSVPAAEVYRQDRFAPIFRVIMSNIVDSVTLFASVVPGLGVSTLETQIRVSPVEGGISNDYAVVATAEAALQANPFVQQISGLPFMQVSLWARIAPGGTDRTVHFMMLIRKSGCCQKTQIINI